MLSTIRQIMKENIVPIDPRNIFIITGVNSKEWVTQTEGRMPPVIRSNNVIHRGEIKKSGKRICNKKNMLIFIDEVHIAYKEGMSVDKLIHMLC